jgi:hypothetical protein
MFMTWLVRGQLEEIAWLAAQDLADLFDGAQAGVVARPRGQGLERGSGKAGAFREKLIGHSLAGAMAMLVHGLPKLDPHAASPKNLY